ncbi:MerR family transcriptional regulator [Cytobacillus sp. Sa5YUA1]|uniref:MerR family transcriptional regulator n=1 Tax=Cytobacillus stercorigallinarum TaxID=2762240 RepID=A0ABR8QTF9_9BACI|nr:MerR family transcriptional regulator [Cytobacillus stercorigallinarum]MBD7938814.1 MerR family transcriptional regulator [Cytobacillus stercorigallinarum]
MTNDYYRIGEFAKKTNTTIRTLHYYDEIGLLKPACTSKTGDRYYSTNEILTMQKIVTLKYLGYPLDKIQELLNNTEWDLRQSLSFQQEELIIKRQQINHMIKTLDHALSILEENQTVDPNIFIMLINSIQMETEHKEWMRNFIPENMIQDIYNISDEKQQQLNKRVAKEFANVKKLVGTDYEDEHVQTVIAAIWDILYELYPNIEGFIHHITEVNEDIDHHLAESSCSFPLSIYGGRRRMACSGYLHLSRKEGNETN